MTDLAPSSSLDIRAEISAAYTAWDSAFNKADAKAVASAYVPNAKALPPTHEVISGPAAIENFFAGLFSSGFTDHNLTIIDTGADDKVVYSTAH
jgi:ketosteroid isomerase-like protein